MLNFEISLPTRMVVGRGVEKRAGEFLKKFGATKVLLHYGSERIKKSGLFDAIVEGIRAEGIEYIELGGVQPNPRLKLVQKGIDLCKKEKVDFVLAIGGGSVIDSSKAIAHGTAYDGDVWDFFTYKVPVTKTIGIGTVLTLPAAGSECSMSCVITKEEGWLKRGVNTELNRPLFSLLNPELCTTLPKEQIAYGAIDMIAHIMERYFTNTKEVAVTDRMSEGVIQAAMEAAKRAYADPTDYDAQADLMWCSTLAHNNILGVGKEQEWSSHQMEHELSALYDVAHGAGLAVIFPAWMRYVYKHDVARFAQFANRVFGIAIDPFDLEKTAVKGIEALEEFLSKLDLPLKLSEMGIGEDRLMEMAQKTKKTNLPKEETLGLFYPLTTQDIYNIFKSAL